MKMLEANRPKLSYLVVACMFLVMTQPFLLSNANAAGNFKYTCTCVNPNGHTNQLQFGTDNEDAKACAAHCQKANYNSGVVTEGAAL